MKIITPEEAQALDLKYYYTGKPCKNGHLARRRISNRRCLECSKINSNTAREKAKARYADYIRARGGICEMCSTAYPVEIFELHHIDPTTKTQELGADYWHSQQYHATSKEADLCALLCPTCHRLEHYHLARSGSLLLSPIIPVN